MELIFNPVVNFSEVQNAQLTKSTLLTSTLGPLGSFQTFYRSVLMLKREWGAKSTGKLPHLIILGKIAALAPALTVKDLPLGRTHDDDIYKR